MLVSHFLEPSIEKSEPPVRYQSEIALTDGRAQTRLWSMCGIVVDSIAHESTSDAGRSCLPSAGRLPTVVRAELSGD